MDTVIQVSHLRKAYGATVAVEDISFTVGRGEIFGMVGPNGAGKTTTVECLEGQRQPDGGLVRVLTLDPRQAGRQLRERIGVQLQESNLHDRIKVWEAMDLFASFYPRPVDWRPLLAQLGLTEKSQTPFGKLSGGQKQRLFIALALLNDPEVLFLDELTTGLDPQVRHAMWDLVRAIRERGKTVFLTTHFMEEAERLCDRVAIVDHGKVIAIDTPRNLVRSLGAEQRVIFEIDGTFDPASLNGQVTRVERRGKRVTIHGRGDRLIGAVIRALEEQDCRFSDLRTEAPTLEDVFLSLTGRQMRD